MNIHKSFRDKEVERFCSIFSGDRSKIKQRLNGYKTSLIRSKNVSPTRLRRVNLLSEFLKTI